MIRKTDLFNTMAAVAVIWSLSALCAFGQTSAREPRTLPSLTGNWQLLFEMPGGSTSDIPLKIVQSEAGLTMTMRGVEEPVSFPSKLVDDELSIELKLGHGVIKCALFSGEKGDFAGICAGPMGDIPTVMSRVEE